MLTLEPTGNYILARLVVDRPPVTDGLYVPNANNEVSIYDVVDVGPLVTGITQHDRIMTYRSVGVNFKLERQIFYIFRESDVMGIVRDFEDDELSQKADTAITKIETMQKHIKAIVGKIDG